MMGSIFCSRGSLLPNPRLPSRFFNRISNLRLSGSGRSSRLLMPFHWRELPARNSMVIWLIQLPPEEDVPCCSIWASLIAEGGIVMAYVPIGVSIALRKYLFPTCSKFSFACPV
jgi:hypothetical protein